VYTWRGDSDTRTLPYAEADGANKDRRTFDFLRALLEFEHGNSVNFWIISRGVKFDVEKVERTTIENKESDV
jgi:hypothetical protein